MTLVNGKIVVTRDQLNMLALGATPFQQAWWDTDQTAALLTSGREVIVVDEWPPAVDVGDGWFVFCMDDVIYVFHKPTVEANIKQTLQESTLSLLPESSRAGRDYASFGLFQQQPTTYFWRGFTV